MFTNLLRTKDNWTPTILRIVAGVVMLPHGMQKMFGWFGGAGFSATIRNFGTHGFPAYLVVLVIAAEFFGSIGLILGALTRIAAFGLLVDMTVAAITTTSKFGMFINWSGKQKGEGMEFQILFIGIMLAILIAGGGAFSVDCTTAGGKRS